MTKKTGQEARGKSLNSTKAASVDAGNKASVSARALMPTDPDVARVLEERAEILARPKKSRRRMHGGDAYVQVNFGGADHYGIPFAYASEVVTASEITPVPGAPGHIAGVINLRGTLLTVVDMRPLLGLAVVPPGRGDSAAVRVVVVARAGLRFGVLAFRVDDRVPFDPNDLSRPIGGRSFVRGVHGGKVAVLDMEALFASSALAVDQAEV